MWATALALWGLVATTNRTQRRNKGPPISNEPVFVIDFENVRGKSGFVLSHQRTLEALKVWSHGKQVVLAMDHGDVSSSFVLPEFSMVFCGNHRKADDCIVNDILPMLTTATENHLVLRTIVITGDRPLMQRCQRVSRFIEIGSPIRLLAELETILEKLVPEDDRMEGGNDEAEEDQHSSGLVTDQELELGSRVLEAEARLRMVHGRKRRELRLKGHELYKKLEIESPTLLSIIQDVLKLGIKCKSLQGITKSEQKQLISKWQQIEKNKPRRETTEDREVLVEEVRQELLRHYDEAPLNVTMFMLKNEHAVPVKYAVPRKRGKSAITLVVVSDSHGCEEQLGELPDGDVLLHLGDFTVDDMGRKREFLAKFDKWLARQPHPIKLVVRGNHDPRSFHFPESQATYYTGPTVKEIMGYTFAFVPSFAAGRRKKPLWNRCDVVASHVPPFKILDRCMAGTYAGSRSLLKMAEKSPPKLWLCGHIHEGRGVVRHNSMTIVNAANANAGLAVSVEYGAAVVELGKTVRVSHMEGQYVFMNHAHPHFFRSRHDPTMLLAVDLGLRTGISLFDNNGCLVRFEHLHLESREELKDTATKILNDWGSISHIAIEGGDPPLLEAWQHHGPVILRVQPEEWRNDLLTEAERRTGESSKAASQTLAQRVLLEHGHGMQYELSADLAESILLGVHVTRRLGWGTVRDPAIVRSSY